MKAIVKGPRYLYECYNLNYALVVEDAVNKAIKPYAEPLMRAFIGDYEVSVLRAKVVADIELIHVCLNVCTSWEEYRRIEKTNKWVFTRVWRGEPEKLKKYSTNEVIKDLFDRMEESSCEGIGIKGCRIDLTVSR